MKELNILIMGQSGVGKSTWINGVVNYLAYDFLEDAKAGGVICTIPASFTVNYEIFKKQVVQIGEKDPNENLLAGKSATQEPRTYTFHADDFKIRLIDTPGLGDSEGVTRDKENMKKVLDHISHFQEIHGICILLKCNETRLNALFRFCIKELLTHLHRDAAKNIVFCFTNARSSFYTPGDTSEVLEKLLEECKLNDVLKLREENMFCLDNEAFRYLCTLKYDNIKHKDRDRKSYEESWGISVEETRRLFNQIIRLKPHKVQDTTTLCNARSRILNLTKPLADIAETIEINMAVIKEKENKIMNSKLNIEELVKNLFMPTVVLKQKQLDFPRTVCTSTSCVKHHNLGDSNVTQVEYVTHCHPHCGLKGVNADQYPNPRLLSCTAMSGNNCKVCKCRWEKHMHITYDQERHQENVVNETVDVEIKNKKSAQQTLEQHIIDLQNKIRELQNEKEIIISVSLKFARFLKEHAIAPFNDGFKDYLDYLIQEKEVKSDRSDGDEIVLRGLRNMLKQYQQEAQILMEKLDEVKGEEKLTPKDIENAEKELYCLKHFGKQIKEAVDFAVASNQRAFTGNEQSIGSQGNQNWYGKAKGKLKTWFASEKSPQKSLQLIN